MPTITPTAELVAADGELLTLKEAAALLKVTRKTLYQWKYEGRLQFVTVAGTLLRIRRSDLNNICALTAPDATDRKNQ